MSLAALRIRSATLSGCREKAPQRTLRAAFLTRSVAGPGRDSMDRCPALTSTVLQRARSAMARCWAGGITLSAVPTRYQQGMVSQSRPRPAPPAAPRVADAVDQVLEHAHLTLAPDQGKHGHLVAMIPVP